MRKINTRNFHRATRTTLREINRQIILNLVREHQPISRADLARQMGVARGMVTSLISELLSDGLIYEGATGEVPRGRKPTLLYIRTHDRLAIAVDVRFSSTQVMLGDFGGGQLALERFSTPFSPEALIEELSNRIESLLEAHEAGGSCEGIGLVVPGVVDRGTRTLLNAPTLGWRNVDLRGELALRTGLPVHIERDAIACALAQMWLGQGAEADEQDSFVYVIISDGVGAGLVINGEVVRGHRNVAGEFGHIPLDLGGPRCVCGSRGCWEAYTSNPATIARYLGRELSTRKSYAELRESGFAIADLIGRAREGDARAMNAVQESGRYLGIGLAGIINALNPARVILGGELTEAWDLIDPIMRQAVAERTLTAAAAETPILPEPTDGYSRLRGATALVVAPVFAAPQFA